MKKKGYNRGWPGEKRGFGRVVVWWCMCVLWPLLGSAQEGYVVSGYVADMKGGPLPGVSVRLDSTNVGTSTDKDGRFSLRLPAERGMLVFSFVGYGTQRVEYVAGEALKVRMKEDVAELGEVVVRAYGSQKTRNLTGAVATVRKDVFEGLANASLENSIQGRMAGVQVLQLSGAPGNSNLAIQVRGYSNLVDATRPLYVIDGVPVTSDKYVENGINPLAEIDPQEIETLTVLKDAAAASIYGSRAANGVVIITTKQGRFGEKMRVQASVGYTVSFRAKHPNPVSAGEESDFRRKALEGFEEAFWDSEQGEYRYATSYDDALAHNAAYNYFYGKGYGARLPWYQDSLSYCYNTNAVKYFFQTARTLNANLQMSGGAENMAYHVNLGYFDEEGTFRNTGFNRVNLSSNVSFRPRPGLTGNVRLYGAYATQKRTSEDKDVFNQTQTDGITKIPAAILGYSAVLPGPGTEMFEAFLRKVEESNSKNYSARLRGNMDLAYRFRGLTLKAMGAVDFNLHNTHVFKPSTQTDDRLTYTSEDVVQKLRCLFEVTANYRTEWRGHHWEALAGWSFQQDTKKDVNMFAKGGATNQTHYAPWWGSVWNTEDNLALKDATSYWEKSVLLGYFGRLEYNFREKVLASVTVRRDASSKFGKKVRWGTFPSYSVGYVVTEEPWAEVMKPWVDFVKVRASYGKSGRQFEDPTIAFGELTTSQPFVGQPTIIPEYLRGLLNERLTWEETDQYNVGLDVACFGRRVNVSADYYYKYTDKLLWMVKLPGIHTGNVQQWRNAYALSNEGIEVQVDADIVRNERVGWRLSFNVAKNWNMLRKSYDGYDFRNTEAGYENNLTIIGKPLNQLYVFDDRGIYQSAGEVGYVYESGRRLPLWGEGNQFYRPGDRIIADVDYNGRVEDISVLKDDRVCAGDPNPSVSGGLTSVLSYAGFTLELHFIGAFGRTILNETEESLATYTGPSMADIARPILVELDGKRFWEKPGDAADYPRNTAEGGLHNFATNLLSNVQRVNFVKLKNVRLSYTLPQPIRERIGFGGTVYCGLQNVATWTNYRGLDPESVSNMTGCDRSDNYPLARMFTCGLTLNF